MTDAITSPGDIEAAIDSPVEVEFGNLRATLSRTTRDWILEYTWEQDNYIEATTAQRLRTVFIETEPRLSLRIATADRGIVAKPIDKLHVPVNQQVTVYMGSPLWLQFVVGATAEMLADLPTEVMSDTWFGTDTMTGHLCYYNPTSARVFLDNLSSRSDRLYTPITFVNRGSDVLMIDRINLPLPFLSIYQADERYWTEELVVTREAALDEAVVEIRPLPPEQAAGANLVAGPREVADEAMVHRVLSALFR